MENKQTICTILEHIKSIYGSLIFTEDCNIYDAHSLADNLIELAKIEGFVELAEVLDCGSVGGFGYKQGTFSKSLTGRLKYLHRKYIKEDRTLHNG